MAFYASSSATVISSPLITDQYQIIMAYAYFQQGTHHKPAIFEYYFRNPPFKGSFAVLNGVYDFIAYLQHYRFAKEDQEVVRQLLTDAHASGASLLSSDQLQQSTNGAEAGSAMIPVRSFGSFASSAASPKQQQPPSSSTASPTSVDAFVDYLGTLSGSMLTVKAFREGSVVFGNEPLIQVSGPLALVQLIETPMLSMVNFASLVTTKAARLVMVSHPHTSVVEFGLRRAQGPFAGMSASKYSYAGGCLGTSNVLAATKYKIPSIGTHAHSFVQTFQSLDDIANKTSALEPSALWKFSKTRQEFIDLVLNYRQLLACPQTHPGELASFISFAITYPQSFVALVDTYDTLRSGVPNFCAVACALLKNGIDTPTMGLRLDSGDLASLSLSTRTYFMYAKKQTGFERIVSMRIIASNDLDEDSIGKLGVYTKKPPPLSSSGSSSKSPNPNSNATPYHSIDLFGVGTKLSTCSEQAALGGVFKICMLGNRPTFKISEEIHKSSLPFGKQVWRVFLNENRACGVDLVGLEGESIGFVGADLGTIGISTSMNMVDGVDLGVGNSISGNGIIPNLSESSSTVFGQTKSSNSVGNVNGSIEIGGGRSGSKFVVAVNRDDYRKQILVPAMRIEPQLELIYQNGHAKGSMLDVKHNTLIDEVSALHNSRAYCLAQLGMYKMEKLLRGKREDGSGSSNASLYGVWLTPRLCLECRDVMEQRIVPKVWEP